MALAQALSNVRYETNKCPVAVIYAKLSAEDQKAFDGAVEKGISTNALMTALHKEGFGIAWNSVERHLKKICKCEK